MPKRHEKPAVPTERVSGTFSHQLGTHSVLEWGWADECNSVPLGSLAWYFQRVTGQNLPKCGKHMPFDSNPSSDVTLKRENGTKISSSASGLYWVK